VECRYATYSRRRKSDSNFYIESTDIAETQKELHSIEYLWKLSLTAWSPFVLSDHPSQECSTHAAGSFGTPQKARFNSNIIGPSIPNAFSKAVPTSNVHLTVIFPSPISCHQLIGSSNNPGAVVRMKAGATIVRVIRAVNHDEALKLWLETCALLADLCWAESMLVIDEALQGLEHLISAESVLDLSEQEVFTVLEDLVNRLPLNIVTATGRQQAILSHVEIVDTCFRSCNLVFYVFTHYASKLRSMEHYNALYIRAVSALVTNASVSPRAQSLHEEMMSMAIALLRILRVPTSGAAVSQQQHQPDSPKPFCNHVVSSPIPSGNGKSNSTTVSTNKGYSIWGLFGLGSGQASETSTNSSAVKANSAVLEQRGQQLAVLDTVVVPEHDRELLLLAWKTTSSMYSLFPGLVKLKDAHLFATLTLCMEKPPTEQPTDDEQQGVTTTAPGVTLKSASKNKTATPASAKKASSAVQIV
jgi:hypothetical protein